MAYNIVLALFLLNTFLCAGVQFSRLNSDDEAIDSDLNMLDDENYAAVIDSTGNMVDINNSNLTEFAAMNRSKAHRDPHDMPEHLRYLPMRLLEPWLCQALCAAGGQNLSLDTPFREQTHSGWSRAHTVCVEHDQPKVAERISSEQRKLDA